MKNRNSRLRAKIGSAIAAAGLVALGIVAPQVATAAPTLQVGDSVWVGPGVGYGGTQAHAILPTEPADSSTWNANDHLADVDFWAYCIEHDTQAQSRRDGVLGDFSSHLGSNLFSNNPAVQAKVLWVLGHSWPVVTLTQLETAAGVTNLTYDDAVEATQYAIWRYTDVGWDAPWGWETPNSEAVYWYLVNGANADTATSPAVPAPITVQVDAPPAGQVAGTLVGPFVVHTNQPTVSVSTASGLAIVDAAGTPIDPTTVTDGTQLYVDATGSTAAGSATITASAVGSSATGFVVSVPNQVGGSATASDHAQSMILAAASTANTSASADTTWIAAPVPQIGTTLVDSADGDQVLAWDGGTVVDTIAYENLTPGVEYTVTGELMLKSDGSGTGITGTTTFTPTAANGTTTVDFTVPAGFAGEVLVAYEELFESADLTTVVAEHKDINDAAQTVTVAPAPAIGTTLVDSADGDQVLGWNGGTLIDTITYQNLTPGVEYTVTGELMNKSTGVGTGITGSTTFTPTEANGTTTVTFAVPVGFGGEVLVAYETLFESADLTTPVAEHKDINDAAQTVTVDTPPVVEEPAIGTSLVDSADDDHVLPAGGGTLIDTVAFQNLTVGTEYTITGELMLQGDGTATGITGTVTFTPLTADGSVEVTFQVPADFAGEVLVAYEELFESADLTTPVAVHQDLNDAAQTVTVEDAPAPAIGTTLVDSADGDHVLGWNGGTLIDTIAYQNLTPGVEYTVTGELMLKGDGSATGITGTTTFTPTEADGTTTVTFTVPVGFGGEVLVAYEELFESADLTTVVAEHKDINDAAQTVTVETPPTVEEPAIGTSLVDSADGDHVLPVAGGVVVDTVAYVNLTPGVEYTITGELMLKGDGSATGITGTVTFTPTTADGSVEVEFTVPAGFAGEALVAYEKLFESADLTTAVAVHEDINDAAQTVTVEQPTTTPTPTPTPTTTPSTTPTATPTTPSTPGIPSATVKPTGPTGLPTTGMNVGPAPLIGAVVLLGIGAFILIARRRANSQR